MNPVLLHSGYEAMLFYASETASYPSGDRSSPPAPPPLGAWAGWINNPGSTINDNHKAIYSLAHPESAATILGPRDVTLQVGLRVGTRADADPPDLIAKCLRGGGSPAIGEWGLANLCLVHGASNANSDGFTKADRFAKCNTLAVSYQSGQEISAQAEFWAITEEAGTVAQPSPAVIDSAIAAMAPPLTWQDLHEVSFYGANFRHLLESASYTVRNNLRRGGAYQGITNNAWSRTIGYLAPGKVEYDCSLTFQTSDAARMFAQRFAGVAAASWVPNVSTALGPLRLMASKDGKAFNSLFSSAYLGQTQKQGGETSAPMSSTVNLVVSGLSINNTPPL